MAMLEVVSKFDDQGVEKHAVYVAGAWPGSAIGGRPTVCGERSIRGWVVHNGGEPTCPRCLDRLTGRSDTPAAPAPAPRRPEIPPALRHPLSRVTAL